MEKLLEGNITFSRPSGGKNDGGVTIRVQDEDSRAQFLTVHMKMEDFAAALMGSSYKECKLEVSGLERVGKIKEMERASVFIGKEEYRRVSEGDYDTSKGRLAQWIRDNHAREGWLVDGYLGSQTSVIYREGGYALNFSYYRYVDKSQAPSNG